MPHQTLTRTSNLLDWIPSRKEPGSLSRLSNLYRRPGPFATVYLATAAPGFPKIDQLSENWEVGRAALSEQGATDTMLRAIDRRLSIDRPSRAAAVCVMAAPDGTTVVDYDTSPPPRPLVTMGPLPAAAQLMEWHQRRVPTLVAHVDDGRAIVSSFAIDRLGRHYTLSGTGAAMALALSKLAIAVDASLILVVGSDRDAASVAAALTLRLPPTCRVVEESGPATPEGLATATVRQVEIMAAGTTLRLVREQRFLATHGAAVEGLADTVESLRVGEAELLMVTDGYSDTRSLWIGSMPRQLSLERTADCSTEVRLVDGLIRSAIQQRITIRIVPNVGPHSPTDDVAAVTMTNRIDGDY